MIFGQRAGVALLVGVTLALPAYGGCALPPAPSKVPDGSTASESEMVAAMQTLKRYNTDVNNYIKCLEFENRQNRLSSDEQGRLHNATIDSLKLIADKFNEQVRVFKGRGG
jgi:hypothetical protein